MGVTNDKHKEKILRSKLSFKTFFDEKVHENYLGWEYH